MDLYQLYIMQCQVLDVVNNEIGWGIEKERECFISWSCRLWRLYSVLLGYEWNMSVEHWWNDTVKKLKFSERTYPSANFSSSHPTHIGLRLNLYLWVDRTATNHLNHGMAIMNWKGREKSCSWPLKQLYPNVENCRVTSLQTVIKHSSSWMENRFVTTCSVNRKTQKLHNMLKSACHKEVLWLRDHIIKLPRNSWLLSVLLVKMPFQK